MSQPEARGDPPGPGRGQDARDGRPRLQDHLGVQLDRTGAGGITGRMPLGPHARTGSGAVSIGAVGALVDQVAGVMSGETQRAPAVTSQISLRLPPMLPCSALFVGPRVLRSGRASVVLMVNVSDGDTGQQVGAALFSAAVLQGVGGSHQPPKDLGRHIIWRRQAEAAGRVTTDEYLDMHVDEMDGSTHRAHLELHDKLLNVSDVLHGGAAMLITEQSALLAACAHGAISPFVDDLDVHFLAPGQVGPLATRTVVVGTSPGRLSLAVELVDQGRDGRLLTAGLVGVGY